jgi:hypothetical protein
MPLINRKTVRIGGADVVVRTMSAWAKTDALTVRQKLFWAIAKETEEDGKKMFEITDLESGRLAVFAAMLVGTESVNGDLGFEWPLPSAPASELVRAFAQIGDCLTGQQIEDWKTAIEEVDAPPGPTELAPDLPEEKKA